VTGARRRAALVVPPTGLYVREERCQSFIPGLSIHPPRPPTDLAIDAAILEEAGWECTLIDAPAEGLPADRVVDALAEFRPDLVVAQASVSTFAADMAFLGRVRPRAPGATFAARGGALGIDPSARLAAYPVLDVVAHSEASAAFRAFARKGGWAGVPGAAWRDRGGRIRVAPAGLAPDLDDMPWPARHLLRNDLYPSGDTGEPQAVIEVARGCPFSCAYCLASREHGARVRRRSPASIAAEVGHCVGRFGIRSFLFLADTFTLDRDWVIGVCRALVDAGPGIRWACNSRVDTLDDERVVWMRRAGCWAVSLGIESGDPETLRRIGKGTTLEQARGAVRLLRRHGILSLGYFMMGFPWDDEAGIRRSFRGFLDIDPDLMEVQFAYPFPGTRLREEMIGAGVIAPDDMPEGAIAWPVARTLHLDADRLRRLRDELVVRFAARPAFVARMARRAARPRVAIQFLRAAWRLATGLGRGSDGFVTRS
jgi:hypothetical protein